MSCRAASTRTRISKCRSWAPIRPTILNPARALGYIDPGLAASYPSVSYYLVYRQDEIWRDGQLMRFVDTYANVPAARTEGEPYTYTFPNYVGVNTGPFLMRNQWARAVASKVVYGYYYGTNPSADITITQIFQPTQTIYNGSSTFTSIPVNFVQDNYLTGFGTTPSLSAYISSYLGTSIVAEATQYRRLYGDIWEYWTRSVVAQ